MYSRLDFLADTIIIEALAKDQTYKIAQDNSIASIATKVKEYVLSQFGDMKDKPVATILAFIAPGILWSLGFRWMAVLYEVAEAMGIDWVGFWEAVKDGVETFLSTIANGEKPSEDGLASHIGNIVSSAMQSHSTGDTNDGSLAQLARKIFTAKDALELKKLAIHKDKILIKNASIKSKLIGFFIKIIRWAITVGLISLGFAAAGGAISAILGIHKDTKNDNGTAGTNEYGKIQLEPVQQMTMSSNVSSDMYMFHNNDLDHIWIMNGELSNIKDIIMEWIIAIFPNLSNSDIQNSSALSNMVALFNARNRFSYGTDLITVPKPYNRKIDIVSQVVNTYLKNNPQQTKPSQPGQNIAYK